MKKTTFFAREWLKKGGYTLVAYDGENIFTDKRRGVLPLLELYERKKSLSGFGAADKVVGKAAAFLYVLLEADEVYADVVSEPALEVFSARDIHIEYETLTKGIINHAGTGPCPMESAVIDEEDPEKALEKIIAKRKELSWDK